MALEKISRKDKNRKGVDQLPIGIKDGKTYEKGYKNPRATYTDKDGNVTTTRGLTKEGKPRKKRSDSKN